MKFIQISKEYIIFVNTYVYKNVLVNILHSSVAFDWTTNSSVLIKKLNDN
jgi:hypothetical protein